MFTEYRFALYLLLPIVAIFVVVLLHFATTKHAGKSITPIIKSSSIAFSTQQSYYRSIAIENKIEIHPSLPSSSLLDLTRK